MKPKAFKPNRKSATTFRPWNAAILGIPQEQNNFTLDEKNPYNDNDKYAKYNLIIDNSNKKVQPPSPARANTFPLPSSSSSSSSKNNDNNNINNNPNLRESISATEAITITTEKDNSNDDYWDGDDDSTTTTTSPIIERCDDDNDDNTREITVKLSGINHKNTNGNCKSSATTTTTTNNINGKKIPVFVLIGEKFVEEEIKSVITPRLHFSPSFSFSSSFSSPSSSSPSSPSSPPSSSSSSSSVLSSSPKQSEQKLLDLSDDEDNTINVNNNNKEITINTAKKKRSADLKTIDMEGFLKQDLEEELKRMVNDLVNGGLHSKITL